MTTCAADGSALVDDGTLPTDDLSLKPGHVVGEYRIERKIGEGGFGAVYSAIHPVIGKSAAIKILSPQFSADPVMVSRFISEARAVNQIRHRGIIDIFAFGKLDDGRQYYIMELLEGKTLEEYLRERGRLRPAEAIPILRQIGRALDAAHAAGIAHRDMKPENVFLVFDEDGAVIPKLLDFGIAKLLGDSQQTKTRTGTPMGTPLYMSPEQCRGKQVDHRTDIYSFGCMTHVMLTGQPVFTGEDIMDVMMAQVGSKPPAASSVCPDIPAALDAPILRMLEKDPAARPPTLVAAVDALVEAARSARIDVPTVATRSSERLPRLDMPQNKSSEDVFAATMVQPGVTIDPQTTLPAAGESKAGGKRTVVLAIAAAFGIAALATGFVMTRPTQATQETPAAVTTPSAEVAPSAAPTIVPVSTAAPSASAAVSEDIELRIQATPENVDVYLGERKLGTAPGPLRLPRGDAPLTVTFSAQGYQSKSIPITPSQNVLIPISLDKTVATVKPKPSNTGKRDDLDY
ncbi:MAG: serine/threonine protein kinase [Polyangiaceae bacterium]|nr:serine/threonine protein kinase [Polyangiaceae bacterium]